MTTVGMTTVLASCTPVQLSDFKNAAYLLQIQCARHTDTHGHVTTLPAGSEAWIVQPDCLPAHYHSIRPGSVLKDLLSRERAADPGRVARAACNLAIQCHGILEDAQRPVLGRSMQQCLVGEHGNVSNRPIKVCLLHDTAWSTNSYDDAGALCTISGTLGDNIQAGFNADTYSCSLVHG